MKQLQELLKFSDNYIFVERKRAIMVLNSPEVATAREAYDNALAFLATGRTDEETFGRKDKLAFDIALDCIRDISDEDIEYINNHLQTSHFHFNYAMGIRNSYLYPLGYMHHEADRLSAIIMQIIFSICNPIYDYRNKVMVDFFENFNFPKLNEQYQEDYKEIFNIVYSNIAEGVYASSDEAINDLENKIREAAGPDEFVRIMHRAYADYLKVEKAEDKRKYWEGFFCSGKAMLYPLYTTHANILCDKGLFSSVEHFEVNSQEECRKFIDENLGLRDDYADYMARCIWEVFNPLTNGAWKDCSVYHLKSAKGSIWWDLEQAGVKTIGDLCSKTIEDIAAISGVGMENAEKLWSELKEMGVMEK